MKHILLGALLLLLGTTSISAQLQFGLKTGLHLNNVDLVVDDGEPAEFATNLKPQLGVWFSVPLSQRLSLQPELLWTQKDWNSEGARDMGVRFNYFSLPVAAAYSFGNWQVTLGPELTFLLDQRFITPIGTFEESPTIEENEFGLGVNLGLQYHLKQWVFGLRANRDLTNFENFKITDINGEPMGDAKFYHQGLTLWVGYELLSR
ncbi:MAG: outer membrane beta-barrel protein [Lewinella sp.]|jgi:hypothetical protein|uniref:outer membrane beta-barrel protein n=1 Tax=Lewinella sp. TaxID=2004506 RepID=UPI003D6A3A45